MWWLLKARVRPDVDEFALLDEITGGPSGGLPFAKELKKALDARPRADATFYFPVEAKDPEREIGVVADWLDVLGKTRMHETQSGWADEDDDRPRGRGRPHPPPRRRRASEEDD